MANETQNPSAAPAAQGQPLAPPSTPAPTEGQDHLGIALHKVVGESTKYTVFAIFVLYSIGFIIWHAYLGRYGVSTIAFLQAEYLAAALCYLFILSTISIPPVLLLKGIARNIKSKGILGISDWKDENWLLIGTAWYYLILRVIGVFLPGSLILTTRGQYALDVIGCVLILHTIIAIVYIRKAGYFRALWRGQVALDDTARAWKRPTIFKYVLNQHIWGIYTLCFGLSFLIFNPKINGWFLLSSMFLYLSVMFAVGSNVFEAWKPSSLMTRVLVVVLIGLIFISNIQSFAVLQFGEIPKSAGGGKPELAYLKFSPQHSDVALSLGLPLSTSSAFPTNVSVFGPVGILFRSDNQILLLNSAETNFLNSTNLMAKEVRADLVDSLIYCK